MSATNEKLKASERLENEIARLLSNRLGLDPASKKEKMFSDENGNPCGYALVFVGDSFTGKSFTAENFVRNYPDLVRKTVSATTRAPRDGEIDGKHYHFYPRNELFSDDKFIEFEGFSSEDGTVTHYGTPKSELATSYEEGKIPVLVLEPKGAFNLKHNIKSFPLENGEEVPFTTSLVVFDISKDKVKEKIVSTSSPENIKKEFARVERGSIRDEITEMGLKDIPDTVVRTDYLPVTYFGDIVEGLPSGIKNTFKQVDEAKNELYLKLSEASNMVRAELGASQDSSYRELLFYEGLFDAKVDEIGRLHNIPPDMLSLYIQAQDEYPFLWENPIDSTLIPCRVSSSQMELASELACEIIDEDGSLAPDNVLEEIGVTIHTPMGAIDSISLLEVKGVDVGSLNIGTDRECVLKENQVVLETKKENAKKREANSLSKETKQTIKR